MIPTESDYKAAEAIVFAIWPKKQGFTKDDWGKQKIEEFAQIIALHKIPAERVAQKLLANCVNALAALKDHPNLHYGTKSDLKSVIAEAQANVDGKE